MVRETSAGGVVIREQGGGWAVAVIRPRGKSVWALPKGHPNPGESVEEAARREVLEETGVRAVAEGQLGTVRYVYQLRGQYIQKEVHFFLFRYLAGEIGVIDPSMRIEVDEARWISLDDAPNFLSYRGERDMVLRARERLTAAPRRVS